MAVLSSFSKSSWRVFFRSAHSRNLPARDACFASAITLSWPCPVEVAAEPPALAEAAAQSPASSNGTSAIRSACALNGSIQCANASSLRSSPNPETSPLLPPLWGWPSVYRVPALERSLSRLARQTGRTKTFYATKLIEENIEDLEDRYLAEARLENRGKRYSTAQVRRQLGLDD